ncbi:MAG: hypothetical protein HYZ31_05920 [Gammaproteobacteria bacterium]|jgi:hypothetical protein|nr:hypothetical protein [Gammaproteobacteria bacterium]
MQPEQTTRQLPGATLNASLMDHCALNKPRLHTGDKNIPALRIDGIDAQENRFMT